MVCFFIANLVTSVLRRPAQISLKFNFFKPIALSGGLKLSLTMKTCSVIILAVLPLIVCSFSTKREDATVVEKDQGQDWDYVTVRPKAHMFYWLYETTNTGGYKNRPLILWLQGGPGGSSTGFGNFNEIGPLDVDLKPRNATWLQTASLLFIDNPVGTGYSYVDDLSALTTNVSQISADLLAVMKAFVKKHPDYETVPFYIFSESYGGKMTAAFSAVLYEAVKSGEIKMNFKGFAMGDSWISPVDSVYSWGPYLKATGNIDDAGLAKINAVAKKIDDLVQQGRMKEATDAWNEAEGVVGMASGGVGWYNILKWGSEDLTFESERPGDGLKRMFLKPWSNGNLDSLMNGPIKKKLKIIPQHVVWGGQSEDVFKYQSGDFMANVTSTVNNLINNTPLTVVVYEGQLDLICDTLGGEMWFNRLDIAEEFTKARRSLHSCGKSHPIGCYYMKEYKNVQFYWVLEAGHMVPSDNPDGALEMVKKVIGGK